MTHFDQDDLRAHLHRVAGNAGSGGGLATAERAMTLAHKHRHTRARVLIATIATALIAVGLSAGLVALMVSLDSPDQGTSPLGEGAGPVVGPESTTAEAVPMEPQAGSPRPPFNVETGPVDPEVGMSYPFDLYTHCGIEFTMFGGREWRAVTPQPEPDRIPGPDGIVTYTGYTAGRMLLVNEGLLRFTITDSEAVNNGETVEFEPLSETAPAPPPCA